MINLARKGKPEKIECELGCGEKEKAALHWHHVVPRTDINMDHSYWNTCVVCSNCHEKLHAGLIHIIGIYPSTKPPLGRSVIYESDIIKNETGITEPYYIPIPKSEKYHAK